MGREALEDTVDRHGFALLLDIHGQNHRCDASELGYSLSAVDFLNQDCVLDRVAHESCSLAALLSREGAERLSAVVRGPSSLGALLEQHGFGCTPSTSRPVPVTSENLQATLAWALAREDGGIGNATALQQLLVRHGFAQDMSRAEEAAEALFPYLMKDAAAQPPDLLELVDGS